MTSKNILFTLALMVSVLAMAQEHGQLCGPTLYWQYDSVTTTLRIYGQGEMNDFSVNTNPWYQYREKIRYVQLEEGLTSLGSRALDGLSKIDSIHIPASLTKIADNALCGPQYMRIVVDSANTVFDSRDDCNAIIETATNTLLTGCKNTFIPASVEHISSYAFCDCNTLSLLECYLDKPLPASTYTFAGVPSTCVIRVNPGTKALYEAAPYWNKFVIEERTIKPDKPTRNSAIVASSVQTKKQFHNGQIMIRSGHDVYTLTGAVYK